MAASQTQTTGKVSLGGYLFQRLSQLGIDHIFGCPGDFNLNLLDHVFTLPSMKWVGVCNELNGAYAADGYARVRGLPGVLITTYGVGELSAINGIAGAYSEHLPIIHIVGTTSRLTQQARLMIHHTLDENWDHTTFSRMSEPCRTASTYLTDDATFTSEIDRVIEAAMKTRHPVYIFIPMDVPDILVDGSRLSRPLDLEIRNDGQGKKEDELVDLIVKNLRESSNPVVLVDMLAQRYGLKEILSQFLETTGLPAYVTPLAKSSVDETSPSFHGLYFGAISSDEIKQAVEGSDLVLHVGSFPSDSNTGGFSQKLDSRNVIELHPRRVVIRDQRKEEMNFVPIFRKLVQALSSWKFKAPETALSTTVAVNGTEAPSGPLEHFHIWKILGSWLKPDDCIIAEVGTSQFGSMDFNLPKNAYYFTQLYFSSIGFTVGALLGAMVARREQGVTGRTVLFVGDGSLQMTVQEISTVLRNGFRPIIFLINNSGYTVERALHGPAQQYNDISDSWDYQNMLKFFGARNSRSYSARTYEELNTVLAEPELQKDDLPQLVEIFMDKYDSPWRLTNLIVKSHIAVDAVLSSWDKQHGRERRVLDSNLFDSPYNPQQSLSNKVVRNNMAEERSKK